MAVAVESYKGCKHNRSWVAIALVAVLVLLVSSAMFKRLDHDEHQFVASAALLARRSLLPYRDYPYFHTPYLVYVDAIAFRMCDWLLLSARALSIVSGFAIAAIVFFLTRERFARHGGRAAYWAACAAVGLLVFNPIFLFTTGRSWNHDLPTLLLALAFLAAVRGVRGQHAKWMCVAGLLAGVSIGVRLTFVLPAGVIVLSPLLDRSFSGVRPKVRLAGWCSLGLVAGLAPLGIAILTSPHQFVFGNFTYPTLNTAIRQVAGYTKSMTPLQKVWFLVVDVVLQPGNAAGIVVLAFVLTLAWRRLRSGLPGDRREMSVLVLLSLSLFVSGMAPTPLWQVYFFSPVVFLALLGAYCLPVAWDDVAARHWIQRVTIASLAVSGAIALPSFRGLPWLWDVGRWTPVRVHRAGEQLACAAGGSSRVLTVCPIVAMEGHLDIFEQMATGPFALRVSPAVSEQDRARLNLFDADDAAAAFWAKPDVVLLTDSRHPQEDGALLSAIGQGRIESHALCDDLTFWTRRADVEATARRTSEQGKP